ncbi:9275_t:CDS:2 [Funneliformis geosporum]|uniref:9275_t:CDS:1 n=1 Tax=Funneliformis geosporum TaxID=1117311 RepID=A0A9W4SYY6_9GLOM|nr:9275_t:CDS:2 [Funneliformis geosporum]
MTNLLHVNYDNDHGHKQGYEKLIDQAEQEETNSNSNTYHRHKQENYDNDHGYEQEDEELIGYIAGLIQKLFTLINRKVVKINDNNNAEEKFEGLILLTQLNKRKFHASIIMAKDI